VLDPGRGPDGDARTGRARLGADREGALALDDEAELVLVGVVVDGGAWPGSRQFSPSSSRWLWKSVDLKKRSTSAPACSA
jgi:hypothetical protein